MKITDEQRLHLKLNMAASSVVSEIEKNMELHCKVGGGRFAALMLKFVLVLDESKYAVLPIAQAEIDQAHDEGKMGDAEYTLMSARFKDAEAKHKKKDPKQVDLDRMLADMILKAQLDD